MGSKRSNYAVSDTDGEEEEEDEDRGLVVKRI